MCVVSLFLFEPKQPISCRNNYEELVTKLNRNYIANSILVRMPKIILHFYLTEACHVHLYRNCISTAIEGSPSKINYQHMTSN